MAHLSQPYVSLNCPEENDETRSEEFESGRLPDRSQAHTSNNHSTTFPRLREERQIIHQDETVCYNHPQLPQYLSSAYTHQTPYPSWEDTERAGHHVWQDSSSFGLGRRAASPHSLPSCLPSAIYQTLSDTSCLFPSRPHSLPPDSIPSLEHPRSLRSFPPTAHMHPNSASFYSAPYPHPPCCGQCVQPQHHMNPAHHCSPRAEHHLPYRPSGLVRYTELDSPFSENGHACPRPKQASPSTTHLSKEQRKVFVTYEADNEEHLKEIIKFVALLRNNGFDTHIDVFEQQLNSISKIDCMERYLNEKDYLIIIIISLKYYETVTGTNLSPETEERTSDTVYIHKQLQSEFIQNGCRNFRFIPILFPGAKKSFVPAWLQNTHIYSWPRDRDDILRRLMRVEKYTPPPIGPLPTIVSVPL